MWAVSMSAHAQQPTPVTKIVNSAGDSVLVSYEGGGFAAFGELGSSPIPAEGSGVRLMWYPAKAAFRAGEDITGFWDDANIGTHSVAFGIDTKASGPYATAMGGTTTASGEYSTALGENTTASADLSTAMGNGTTASGLGATAMGFGTTASGFAATAMGQQTTAAVDRSLSIGACNSSNTSGAESTLFVAGNGQATTTGCDSRSDALELSGAGNLTISGTLTENSDRRLKTQVESMSPETLQKLEDLRPVRYRFKNQETHPAGPQIGLVAQDVRKEFPALVSEGAGGYLSLAYPKLTAVLVKGVQEQQAMLRDKQAQIDTLKRRVQQVEALRARVTRLEADGGVHPARVPVRSLALLVLGGLLGIGLLHLRRSRA